MDLSTARTELRNRGFTDLTNSRLNTFLNAGKNTFEDLYAWPWLETTQTGTSPMTISDLKSVLMVSDTTQRNILLGMDRQQVLRIDPTLAETRSPACYWYLTGESTLKIWPATSASLSVLYIKFSAELSLDSDTPLIPSRYHDVWIDFAAVEAYRDNDEFDAASALYQVAAARAGAIANLYLNRNWQNGTLFVPMFSSEDW